MQTLGAFIREKREVQKMQPIVLAKLIGCSRQYLHRIERDEERPGERVLFALAKHLRLSQKDSDELFRCAGRIPPDVLSILTDPANDRLLSFIRENRRAGDESGSLVAMKQSR